MSVRAAAKEFGLSKSAVERHKNGHLRPSISAGNIMGSNSQPVPLINPKYPGAAPVAQDDADLDLAAVMRHLKRTVDRLAQAVDEAADTGTFQGLSNVSGQLIKALDRVCELKGYYPDKSAAQTAPAATAFAVQIILPPGAPTPGASPPPSPNAHSPMVVQVPVIDISFDQAAAPMPPHASAGMGGLLEDLSDA